ncbi:MAG: hypothetical protein FJ368_04600 [Pelagibacterales bacterium]|nr:hypothetical protein [Pelagibacterales bacterium]
MDITPLIPKGRNLINSYSENNFTISEKEFTGSIILQPTVVEEISFQENDLDNEEKFLNLFTKINISETEIILIGTGNIHKIINYSLKQKLRNNFPNISISEMTTSAACRTFNILTLEDRKVAAILIK